MDASANPSGELDCTSRLRAATLRVAKAFGNDPLPPQAPVEILVGVDAWRASFASRIFGDPCDGWGPFPSVPAER